jgi:hypothetical protein
MSDTTYYAEGVRDERQRSMSATLLATGELLVGGNVASRMVLGGGLLAGSSLGDRPSEETPVGAATLFATYHLDPAHGGNLHSLLGYGVMLR